MKINTTVPTITSIRESLISIEEIVRYSQLESNSEVATLLAKVYDRVFDIENELDSLENNITSANIKELVEPSSVILDTGDEVPVHLEVSCDMYDKDEEYLEYYFEDECGRRRYLTI